MATPTPSNQSEFQLYRVLQRANLLQYYQTFIAQGGDDVQQLYEAAEEEFLEIMALVGMASKPLHVRRLQKTLQEWATNPSSFLMGTTPVLLDSTAAPALLAAATGRLPQHASSIAQQLAQANATAAIVTSRMYQQGDSQQEQPSYSANTPTKRETLSPAVPEESPQQRDSPSPAPSNSSLSPELQPPSLDNSDLLSLPSSPGPSDAPTSSPTNSVNSNSGSIPASGPDGRATSPGPPVALKDNEIAALAESAARIAQKLPHYEPKRMNLKKQICREIEALVQMPMEAEGRMELVRKYGAIYGRFDSKRKNEKPMTLHEISVNEASAQLCWHRPGLLTRREELFPLARDVVRASGYQYAKGHSRAQGVEQPPPKRMKFTEECQQMMKTAIKAENDKSQERLAEIDRELQELLLKQEKLKVQMSDAKGCDAMTTALRAEEEAATTRQLQLLTEQSDLMRRQRKSHKNRYSKHGIHTVDDIYGNGYPPVFPNDVATASTASATVTRETHAQRDTPQKSSKKTPKTTLTQLSVQESLFDEGLRIAQQYGMADFAEAIKGLSQHDNTDTDRTERQRTEEINGNYEKLANSVETEGTQEETIYNQKTQSPSHEQDPESKAQSKNTANASKDKLQLVALGEVFNITPVNQEMALGGVINITPLTQESATPQTSADAQQSLPSS